jgi:hypothetical protein
VKKLIVAISTGWLCLSFTLIPSAQRVNSDNIAGLPATVSYNNTECEATEHYTAIGLQEYGLSPDAFTYAYKGYARLLEKDRISKTDYLTICDFSQSSKRKRLYIIDLANNKLVINTWVAHGRNSGAEYATRFSNRPESLQSSLGFYITRGTYYGEHGLSLKVDGVDPGYNNNALVRNIVIHGASYVDESRIRNGMYMGRSWGCPAIPQKESATIITTIKNGSCLFIYHPDKNYLKGSKILNG